MEEDLNHICGGGQEVKTLVSKTGNCGFDSPAPYFNVAMAESGLMHFPAKEESREGPKVRILLATFNIWRSTLVGRRLCLENSWSSRAWEFESLLRR